MDPDARAALVAVVEAYLDGLHHKDLSRAPLADDVVFEGPTTPQPLQGAEVVRAFLSAQFPVVNGVRVRQHIVEGEWVATLFDYDTRAGVIPVFDLFHVVGGQLKAIRPFFDPSPLRAPPSA